MLYSLLGSITRVFLDENDQVMLFILYLYIHRPPACVTENHGFEISVRPVQIIFFKTLALFGSMISLNFNNILLMT